MKPFESLAVSYIEVLRGANAFDYGALNLGGGLNFACTPATSLPLQLRFGGQFGYSRSTEFWKRVRPATIREPHDFRSTVFATRHAKAARRSNVGYRFSPQLATRFLFYYAHQTSGIRNHHAGALYENPSVTPPCRRENFYREAPGTTSSQPYDLPDRRPIPRWVRRV